MSPVVRINIIKEIDGVFQLRKKIHSNSIDLEVLPLEMIFFKRYLNVIVAYLLNEKSVIQKDYILQNTKFIM